jgi:hypothetical protein
MFTLNMEAIRSSETLVTTFKTTQRDDPENHHQHLHHNFKGQIFWSVVQY